MFEDGLTNEFAKIVNKNDDYIDKEKNYKGMLKNGLRHGFNYLYKDKNGIYRKLGR